MYGESSSKRPGRGNLDDRIRRRSENHWSQTTRLPSEGEMMPDFALVSINGKRARISDYRGRRNLVLIFCARGNSKQTRNSLRQLFEQRSEFEGEEAQVLVIVPDADDRAELPRDLPLAVQLDEEGHAHDLARVPVNEKDFRPVIYIVHRYGKIRVICRAGKPSCANAGAILEWVQHINLECPE